MTDHPMQTQREEQMISHLKAAVNRMSTGGVGVAALLLTEIIASEEKRLAAGYTKAPPAPGMTDLMVTPESLDKYLADNPPPAPPAEDAMEIAQRVVGEHILGYPGEGLIPAFAAALTSFRAAGVAAERERVLAAVAKIFGYEAATDVSRAIRAGGEEG